MPHDPYRALYLHLPFCVKRCAYCDFATAAVPADSPEIDAYVEDLCLQIRRKAKEGELGAVETVYLGGGTPSHVGLARLSMLLYTLSLSMHLTPEVECTMEANPESLDGRMVRDVWALGVNRLSLGVQSFDDAVLRTLGRAHTADDARRAVEAARTRFENVSVDVMCGIPGQSEASFEESVREAVRLGVTHVSVYPLTIEPHTPFDAAVLAGEHGRARRRRGGRAHAGGCPRAGGGGLRALRGGQLCPPRLRVPPQHGVLDGHSRIWAWDVRPPP